MKEDEQAIQLQETYRQLDTTGKKKLVLTAVQLLNAQKTLKPKGEKGATRRTLS